MLIRNRMNAVQNKDVVHPDFYKWLHFSPLTITLWKSDIFFLGYHIVWISHQPLFNSDKVVALNGDWCLGYFFQQTAANS